jgi:hypothetical protein
MEAGVLQAQNAGFAVIIGVDWGTFSQSQLSQYENAAKQEAAWAQANGVTRFSLGNEQEYRLNGVSQSTWASDLRAIATAVRTVYSGTLSYETSGDFAQEWQNQSLGSIDYLGLNLYNSYYPSNASALQNEINAHGLSHVYISETNCDVINVTARKNDTGLAAEVAGDAVKLHENFPNTPMYFFTFSANGGDGASSTARPFNTLKLLLSLAFKYA